MVHLCFALRTFFSLCVCACLSANFLCPFLSACLSLFLTHFLTASPSHVSGINTLTQKAAWYPFSEDKCEVILRDVQPINQFPTRVRNLEDRTVSLAEEQGYKIEEELPCSDLHGWVHSLQNFGLARQNRCQVFDASANQITCTCLPYKACLA